MIYIDPDWQWSTFVVSETCEDSILNQDEEKTDCGGSCPACPGSYTRACCLNVFPIRPINSILNSIWYLSIVEEVPQDVCKNYNGIPHRKRPVCCHKKCPECGGKNWKKLCKEEVKDGSGTELGDKECCGWRIEKRGQTCGKNGQKAPCRLEEY